MWATTTTTTLLPPSCATLLPPSCATLLPPSCATLLPLTNPTIASPPPRETTRALERFPRRGGRRARCLGSFPASSARPAARGGTRPRTRRSTRTRSRPSGRLTVGRAVGRRDVSWTASGVGCGLFRLTGTSDGGRRGGVPPVHTSAGFTLCLSPLSGSTHSRHPRGFGSRYIFTPRTSAHPTNSAGAPGASRLRRRGNPSCRVPLTSTSTRGDRRDLYQPCAR